MSSFVLIQGIKMNETLDNFLLVGDKFMPGMHLRQPGFTYSACGPYTNNKEKIQKFSNKFRIYLSKRIK